MVYLDVALSLTIYFYEVVKDMPPFHLPLHDAGSQDDEAISKPKQNIDGSGQKKAVVYFDLINSLFVKNIVSL